MTVIEHIEILTEVACRILEDQVFMFGDVCEKKDFACDADPYVMASVDFDGPSCGTYFWIASQQFGIELAANMLGEDSDNLTAISGSDDALKELSNVICCQFLTSVHGTEPIFALSSPISQRLDAAKWSSYIKDRGSIGIVVDEHPVLLGLMMKDR
jgi:hypothetical protein